MQNTVNRFGNLNVFAIKRIAGGFQSLHVAGHFRRFAEQHVERHVDWLVVEMTVFQRQVHLFGCFTDNGVRRALAFTDSVELLQLSWRNGHYVTFLRLVTPDFERAHARFVVKNIAQLEAATAFAVAYQLRHGVRQAARAHVVDKQNRVRFAQLPAAVDNFLTTTLHFWVITLYGGEIEVGIRLTRSH